MKTKFFTIADGPYFGYMAKELSQRLKKLNDIDLVILRDDLAKAVGCDRRQYWLKAFLWDYADGYDRIGYFDADILPIAPLPQAILDDYQSPFMARLDIDQTGYNQRHLHYPVLFSKIVHYFNNGVFFANRSAEPVFDRLKKEMNNTIHASCVEQTWMNKIVDDTCGVTLLPKRISHLVTGEPEMEDRCMIHYAGLPAPQKLNWFMRDMETFKI